MTPASPYRLFLATAGFFTLVAGEAWRYLLSWWGWGAIVVALVILATDFSRAELVDALVRLHPVQAMIEDTLGREVDLAPYGGLSSKLDDDILREAVPL